MRLIRIYEATRDETRAQSTNDEARNFVISVHESLSISAFIYTHKADSEHVIWEMLYNNRIIVGTAQIHACKQCSGYCYL